MSLSALAGASLLILLTPGPTNTLLAAAGASGGLRRNLALPLAEASGYAVVISAYLIVSEALSNHAGMLALLKLANLAWLAVTAARLWRLGPKEAKGAGAPYGTVLVATLLNPKAMLVGLILIPALSGASAIAATFVFAAMSVLAGLGWVTVGAHLPEPMKQHANRIAANIVAAMAVFGAISLGQA